MKYITLLVSLMGLAAATPKLESSLEPRQPGPQDLMIFLCNEMPDVCVNMCFGAFCADIGNNLQYDKPDAATKRRRRKAAGCIVSGGNRCSTRKGAPPGQQCDEYPFASTIAGQSSTRINKCVPARQNAKQGGTINAFYQKAYCNGGPCNFEASFANAGNIQQCSGNDEDCINDGIEFGPGGDVEPASEEEAGDGTDDVPGGQEEPTSEKRRAVRRSRWIPVHRRFRTSSGLEIMVPNGRGYVGQRAFRVVPLNATLWDEQAETHNFDVDDDDEEFDYMLPNLELVEDTVVEELY